MKVYVESKYIPEKCSKCKFIGHYENGIYSRNPHCCCELYWDLHQDEIRVDKNSRDKNCPLNSLADHDKQVRKEVCEEIRNMSTHYEHHINEEGYDKIDVEQFIINKELLDQIQGE